MSAALPTAMAPTVAHPSVGSCVVVTVGTHTHTHVRVCFPASKMDVISLVSRLARAMLIEETDNTHTQDPAIILIRCLVATKFRLVLV